ncbi:MAG: amidohydrolase [Pseudomonadota bacterium]
MRHLWMAAVAPLALGMALPAAAAKAPEAQKTEILASVDKLAPQISDTALKIWSFAELGYLENQSTALLQQQFRDAGFEVKTGVAEIPTAFVASFKNGEGPVIAILGEFDALPGMAQAASPARQGASGAPGHACGHNLFGAGSMGAALAVKAWMQKHNVKGEVRFYGTPAEESGGGKVYMVRAGLFKDVDVTLHWHASDANSADQGVSSANMSGKFRWRGQASHAAGAPERGRSAVDAAEIHDVIVSFMREHIPDRTRIHNVITSGGSAPNVVPDFAESYYYVRQIDPAIVRSVMERVKRAADGAAHATETQVEFELVNGVYGLLPNDTLGKVMDANLRRVGGPKWTPEETAFAEKISTTLPPSGTKPLPASEIAPYQVGKEGLGSTDVGDVSYVTPTVGLRVATWAPGTPSHSWQAVAASGTSIGTKGAVVAAKTLALTAADLFLSPDVIAKAKTELDTRRGPGFTYSSMAGDRKPPLDYRKPARAGGGE